MATVMRETTQPDRVDLVPAYIDYGPTHDTSTDEAVRALKDLKLQAPSNWKIEKVFRTTSLVRFARSSDVPPWVGGSAMLDSGYSPSPPIADETRIPLLYFTVIGLGDSFDAELSSLSAQLARLWADSLLRRAVLRRTGVGNAVLSSSGFVLDTGLHLLRMAYSPGPSAPSDPFKRSAFAQQRAVQFFEALAGHD